MKKIIVIIILIFLIITSLGCINTDDNGDKEKYFSLWYSTSSDIEENVTIIIRTNGIEVFNETIIPQEGQKIYEEKSTGKVYYVKAIWNNNVSETEFEPGGTKTLYLVIRKGNMSFKVAQD